VLEDYYECLHHKKEVRPTPIPLPRHPIPILIYLPTLLAIFYVISPGCWFFDSKAARTLALQAAYRKAEANIKRDDAPSAGEIRRLGVLDAPLEEKNLKASKWFPHKEIN
jgi:hypothetical protein